MVTSMKPSCSAFSISANWASSGLNRKQTTQIITRNQMNDQRTADTHKATGSDWQHNLLSSFGLCRIAVRRSSRSIACGACIVMCERAHRFIMQTLDRIVLVQLVHIAHAATSGHCVDHGQLGEATTHLVAKQRVERQLTSRVPPGAWMRIRERMG